MIRSVNVLGISFFVEIYFLIIFIQVTLGLTDLKCYYLIPSYVIGTYFLLIVCCFFINKRSFFLLLRIRRVIPFFIRNSHHLKDQFKVVVVEELFWRLIPVTLFRIYLDPAFFLYAIILLVAMFTFIHFPAKEVNIYLFVEFFAFHFLTTCIFYYHGDFNFILVSHLVRNHLIYTLRKYNLYYVSKAE